MKLLNVPQKVYDDAYKLFAPNANAFNVTTHGDLFLNNLLYRYDENGRPTNIRFVSTLK